jgi:hypothetical protein
VLLRCASLLRPPLLRACTTCLLCALAWSPACAGATQSVKLAASLKPERLGQGTTVGFSFTVAASRGTVPSPLTAIELRYPRNLGFALSELGLETCERATLEARGLSGCPANSRMGLGTALAEVPVGPLVVREPANVTIVRAATTGGRLSMLFYVNGESPVIAQLVFPGRLLPSEQPFGGSIGIEVPTVPGLPEGPNVSVVRLRAAIGPEHLTYLERVRGKTVGYTPRGILLPKVCPAGGFRFSGAFRFADGSQTSARATVPCPSSARQRGGAPSRPRARPR